MEERLLALDYDNVRPDFIFRELAILKFKFNLPLDLYTSSERHYHIRSNKPIPIDLAFEVLEFSRCSQDYKAFCKRVKLFPIRTGTKTKYSPDGSVEVRPPPIPLLSC